MKTKSIIITLLSICLINCGNSQEAAKRIESIENLRVINVDSGISLQEFATNYKYPAKLPKDFYWNIPDTSNWTYSQKMELIIKYEFDQVGKTIAYYYVGSKISGVFPQPYQFVYNKTNPTLVKEILDPFFNKEKYIVNYDQEYFIESIIKTDSLDNPLETIRVKKYLQNTK